MTIRLNKVTRDLNVGIATVVEFLQKKGYTVEANPNTKITEEQYAILVKEFSTDKNLRLESERFIQERQNKDRNKASVSIDGYDKKEPEKTVALIGYPLRHKSQVRKITPLIHIVVCLLLFLLGLSIGLNRLIIDNLGYFCGQAAVISSLSILGSMMASLAVYHIFFKGKGASGEK